METLKIQLFGQLRVYRGEMCFDKFATCKAESLFCYLVVHRRIPHARTSLASLFWGESSDKQARKCLRTTLWRLRSILEPDENVADNERCVLVENDEIWFNNSCDFWLDVQEFESCFLESQHLVNSEIGAGRADSETISLLVKAVELYQGDFLEGRNEDWCLYERERLQGMFLNALTKLITYYRSQGQYDEALRCGQRILSYDPLLEEVHREIMRLHSLAGNRAASLRQYRMCQAVLTKELGIEPMEETTLLYTQICRGEESYTLPARNAGSKDKVATSQSKLPKLQAGYKPLTLQMDDALSELRLAQAAFGQSSARFQKALQALESIRQNLAQK